MKSKKNIKKNIKKWNNLYLVGKLNLSKTMSSLNSWFGHAKHCNSYKLQQKISNSCCFLYNNKSFAKIEEDLLLDIENFKEESIY